MDFWTYLPQLFSSGITIGAIYALVALGFVTISRASQIINFAQGEFVML
ncbi:MAG: branched-chain amino acid ABC transporter permease, partial [Desulfobacterales bacterium]|nr:branched-chain amino acid ABC transporter permease [Desulfobacterales bacterium]